MQTIHPSIPDAMDELTKTLIGVWVVSQPARGPGLGYIIWVGALPKLPDPWRFHYGLVSVYNASAGWNRFVLSYQGDLPGCRRRLMDVLCGTSRHHPEAPPPGRLTERRLPSDSQ